MKLRAIRFWRSIISIGCLFAVVSVYQVAGCTQIGVIAPPGANYDAAEFRLWYPKDAGRLQAVLVLVPGSNSDGRAMVDDPIWQSFATRRKLALVGCRFTDKPHEQGFIEQYANASQGSGQALLDALAKFSGTSSHSELADAPLLLWGMSAGGEFNYEFAAWKPERVVAFVVNKGGIYYTALVPGATRKIPGILFTGEKDLESRKSTIMGLFAVNRRAGALWTFAEEPGVAHVVGRSQDMAVIFFDDVLTLRLPESSATGQTALSPVNEKTGFIGDMKSQTFRPAADGNPPDSPTSWLPTIRVANAWQAFITGKPFDH